MSDSVPEPSRILSNTAKDLGQFKVASMEEIPNTLDTLIVGYNSLFFIFRKLIGDWVSAGEKFKFQKHMENIKKKSTVTENLVKYKRFVLFISNLGLHEHAPMLKKWCKVSYLYHRTKCRIQTYTIKCKEETGNNLLTLKPLFEPIVAAMRPIVEYNNSTPKKLISGDVETMLSDVPFIEFSEYC
jgi:hypothetical protein